VRKEGYGDNSVLQVGGSKGKEGEGLQGNVLPAARSTDRRE